MNDKIDRRQFLKAATAASMSAFIPGFQAWAAGSANAVDDGNKLVVVFLRGAVDGLSIVVPHGESLYYSVRPKIAIQSSSGSGGPLVLDSDFSIHPSLAPLVPLWKNKSLAFVLNSGSPDPTRSHFDAQDYMESGIPGNKTASTGWLNRLLTKLPNNNSPVRAINLGTTTPRILQGPVSAATYTPTRRPGQQAPIDRPMISDIFRSMYEGRNDDLERAYCEGMEARATIKEKLSDEQVMANQGALPANRFGAFGKQLGKLLRDEPKIQVAFVGLGGFDTHVNQGAAKGQLANQLNTIGNGLSELVTALGPTFKKTTILVMSEFGRTVKENGNGGTDHGHGNCLWMLGGSINGGKMYGRWNGIHENALYEGRDLPATTDFRAVLSSVIGEQMNLSRAQLEYIFPEFKQTDKSLANLLT